MDTQAGKFCDNPTGTEQDATLDIMDHQGSGRTRSAADTRGQAPWAWLGSADAPGNTVDTGPGTAPQPAAGRGTGAQALLGSGTGTGTGAQPVPGTGAQPARGRPSPLGSPGRAAARGFPPGRGPSGPPEGGSGSWHTPREPFTGDDEHVGDDLPRSHEDTAPADDTDPIARIGSPGPAAPAAPASPAGRRRNAQAKPKRRLGSRSALLATAAVVVVAAGFTGYKFLYEPRVNAPVPATLRLPTTAPASLGFDQALGKWQHIGTRTTDPDPLTIAGLFPPQFVLNGSSYVRAAATVTKKCSAPVYGADLQAALQSGHCSQVARASYVSGDGKMMGTVGVVNLSTSATAQKAGQVTGPQEIIVPLSSRSGVAKKLGTGTGVVQAEIKGHYLILMWAEFANLKAPSTPAARQQLEQFATTLVTGTANINLSTRLLTGKS